MGWGIDRLDEELTSSVVMELRAAEPGAVGVVVTGSYAKGTATGESDLDMSVLAAGPPQVPYRTWFRDRPGLPPLHISVGARSMADWVARANHPVGWSLGFPAIIDAAYLWATPEARQTLGDPPSRHHPPGAPELEDFIEAVMKAKKARSTGDLAGMRWHAHDIGLLAPGLLIPLNVPPEVGSRREALTAALGLSVGPVHYREDLTVCLGLAEVGDSAVAASVSRLAREVLAFLRERAPSVDPQPELARYLADGTLERHVASVA